MSSDRGSQVWGPDPPPFNPRTPPRRRPVGPRADLSEPEVVETTVVRATLVEGAGTAGAGDVARGDASEGIEGADGAEEIREEIEQTRTELSGTIDAIQERLQPRNLVADAKEAARDAAAEAVENVRDATIGKAERMVSNVGETVGGAGTSIMDTIRSNPVPAALAGISLGWLFMKRGQGGQGPSGYAAGGYAPRGGRAGTSRWYGTAGYGPYAEAPDDGGGVGETISRAGERAGEIAGQARETVAGAASEARERVGDLASTTAGTAQGAGASLLETVRRNPLPAAVTGLGIAWLLMNRESGSASPYPSRRSTYDARFYDGYGRAGDERGPDAGARISEAASGAAERAGDVRDAAVERVGEVGDQAQQRLQQARGQLDRWLYETPLAVGAAALGLGAAVGLAVPGTAQESRLLGEARDSLLDKAQETVQETGQKVGRVAEQVQRTATDEARQQQLVS